MMILSKVAQLYYCFNSTKLDVNYENGVLIVNNAVQSRYDVLLKDQPGYVLEIQSGITVNVFRALPFHRQRPFES